MDAAPHLGRSRAVQDSGRPAGLLSEGVPLGAYGKSKVVAVGACSFGTVKQKTRPCGHFKRAFYLLLSASMSMLSCGYRVRICGGSKPYALLSTDTSRNSLSLRLGQVGQFLGARADFIPEPICRQLSLLQDQVRAQTLCKARVPLI